VSIISSDLIEETPETLREERARLPVSIVLELGIRLS
jgi:hypothetical protein